jgi:type II secretory pathway component PulJ
MRRLRDESGMTVMEVLVASTIGTIVVLAIFAMLDSSVRMNTGVMSRTDAMQRGRLAMDVLTQELRSQVCLVDLTPAIVPESDGNAVSFYSDFSEGDGAEPPTKRKLSFDPATGNIRTEIFAATVQEPRNGQFTPAPTTTNLRLENAMLEEDVNFLQYYAYEWKGNPPRPEATLKLPTPLSENDARRVARIDISFISRPTGETKEDHGVHLTDQIMARHSDPNLARWDPINPSLPDPRCV